MLMESVNRHATEWSLDAVLRHQYHRTRVAQTGTLVHGVLLFTWFMNYGMHVVYIYIHMCKSSNSAANVSDQPHHES